MRILHVFRSPVGGLFRHVSDLAKGQRHLGHDVAVLCDSRDNGEASSKLLQNIEKTCNLGLAKHPISRLPSPSDISAIRKVRKLQKQHKFDVIHGHGAKGGLLARLGAVGTSAASVYTPHGGSLHFSWSSVSGLAFLSTEKILSRIGDGFVFVCDFEKDAFTSKVGLGGGQATVVKNALWPEEFSSQNLLSTATDLLFVGEVRHLKGIDVLFDAMVRLQNTRPLTLTVVGDGPELDHHKTMAKTKGLGERVTFAGRLPITEALRMGKVMVVPSRNESFPYVVLEAIAGQSPIIATRVGGIPEILPPQMLVEPDDADALSAKIDEVFQSLDSAKASAKNLAEVMRKNATALGMAQSISSFYQQLK